MKKTFIAALLMVAVTMMTFAGGFNFGPKGELADGANEVVQLEKEYQLVSLLNYTGFTKAQLDEIIAVVEKTQSDIADIEEDVKEELEEALELAKAGDTAKATEKHDEAISMKKELVTVKDEFTTAIKSVITVEQQEKMMQYAMQTAMKGMRQGRDFANKTSAVQGRNGETAKPVMENMKNTVKNSDRYQQLPKEMKEKVEQFTGSMQKATEVRNPTTLFFGALLMEDNLEIVKEYAAGLTE